MAEYRRVHCIYHQDEYITNFCKEKNCLMPLCPSCIGAHNQYHFDKGIKANYINIFESLAEVQTAMQQSLYCLEDDKKRNEQIMGSIHSLSATIRQKILHAKNLVYNVVDAGFQQLERQVIFSLQRRHEQTGIFSIKAAQKLQSNLLVGIAELLQMIDQLRTDKCLSNMIKFYSQSEVEFETLHNKTTATLHTNQHYHPSVEINQDALANLKGIIGKFIHVKLTSETVPEYGTLSRVSRIKRPPFGSNISKTPPKIIRTAIPGVSANKLSPYTRSFIQNQSPARSRVLPPPLSMPLVSAPIQDYDDQFKQLSRKVKQMRRQNQILSQALRKF